MIEIFEPRYHDRRVLIAQFRIPAGKDFLIKITKGACAGVYKVTNEIVKTSPVESMKTKSGGKIAMRAVPLDKLERLEDDKS